MPNLNTTLAPLTNSTLCLLIRNHGITTRTPIHRRLLLVNQTSLKKLQKEKLVPFIILRIHRRKSPRPIITQTQLLHLPNIIRHSPLSKSLWMLPSLNRRILRRQTQSIKTHRIQNLKTPHPLKSRQYIPNCIIQSMSHM